MRTKIHISKRVLVPQNFRHAPVDEEDEDADPARTSVARADASRARSHQKQMIKGTHIL